MQLTAYRFRPACSRVKFEVICREDESAAEGGKSRHGEPPVDCSAYYGSQNITSGIVMQVA
jgi:hypothetical protein